jgi:hypothetical protein
MSFRVVITEQAETNYRIRAGRYVLFSGTANEASQ